MPGFCSCGFSPRPSGGTQSRRSNGLEPRQIVARKNTSTSARVPETYGISSRLLVRLDQRVTAENIARMSAQKSSDPDWPPQNAAIVYTTGRFALVNDATYLMEKSWVRRAVHSPIEARTTMASVA